MATPQIDTTPSAETAPPNLDATPKNKPASRAAADKPKRSHEMFFDKQDRAYLPIESCGIPRIIILVDCMTLVYFGRRRTPLLLVDDVIAWHIREATFCTGAEKARHLTFAENLKTATERLRKAGCEGEVRF